MKRKEFIEKLGIGAAFVLTSTCLGGCTRDNAEPIKDLDLLIDLTDDEYLELQNFGSYVVIKDYQVVIARSNSGEYVAATLICSHELFQQIIYSEGGWFCTAHEARFSEDGEGLNAQANKGLQIFKTDLDGDLLRVTS